MAAEYKDKLKVLGANVEEAGETAATLQIFGIPALVFFKNGQEVHRITGVVKKEKLVDEIKKRLGV